MKVCVVGAGNTGSAHAAVLARAGHAVSLLKTTEMGALEHFETIRERGGIVLRDRDGFDALVPLVCASADPREALAEPVDVILVLTQTTGLAHAADVVGSALKHARMTIVAPGYLGSVFFRRAFGSRCDIFAEGESPAYDARIEEPGAVRICFRNVRDALGFYDPDSVAPGLAIARELVDAYQYSRANVVDAALRNPNLVLHTLGCVTSAARIEYSGGDFWMYREGFTPSVWRALERLDAEKLAVIRAFGGGSSTYLQDCAFRNAPDPDADPLATFQSYAASGGPKGPSTLETRYLTEDVPNGLGLLCSLGAAVGVPTPTAEAVARLAGALLGHDFMAQARTLETLGFHDVDEFRRFCGIDAPRQ